MPRWWSLKILRPPGREEFRRIAFYKNRGHFERVLGTGPHFSLVTVGTSYASEAADVLSRAPETAPVNIEPDEPVELRVFVDRGVVEVFVNSKQCAAVRFYPERADSIGVSIRAPGADALADPTDPPARLRVKPHAASSTRR
ncbi:MAG: GH32 C-terminal domain-containing protein [Chloroflexi bacterium]|nr:GH32 C-terminal domain-containing protein [Chloroflexota bacterium]